MLTFKNYILGECRKYNISSQELRTLLGLSTTSFYTRMNDPLKLTVKNLIDLQKLTKITYSDLILLAQGKA